MSRPPRLAPERLRGVVFDLDGTLVDSYAAITESVNAARGAFDLPPLSETRVRGLVGHGLEALLERVLGPDRVSRGVALFRERYAEAWASGTRALPGARATLQALRDAGFGATVASNKPARFGRPILERLELAQLLDDVLGPDVVGTTKPDPAMLRACMRRMGTTAEETVYVGDMVLDVETAARAGTAVVLVRGGSSPEAELVATGAPLIDRLPDLMSLLRGSSAKSGRPAAPPSTDGV